MTRIAVLSDVNANLEALAATLDDIAAQSVDEVLFLGDAVGYGPDPEPCVSILRDRADVYLRGRIESYITSGRRPHENEQFVRMLEDTERRIADRPRPQNVHSTEGAPFDASGLA